MRHNLLEHTRVLRCIGHDGHKRVILGGTAQHAGPTNVDVLDRIVTRAVCFRNNCFKRIENHADKIDGFNRVLSHRSCVLRIGSHSKQPAVHFGVQGLHAPFHHLWKASDSVDARDCEARIAKCLSCASS